MPKRRATVRRLCVWGATLQELMRLLAYPKLKLSAAEQHELLADYLPYADVVAVPEPPPRVPDCRDPHDLPFLRLAAAGKAELLVSGDADLLALAAPGTRPRLRCRVLTVQALLAQLRLLPFETHPTTHHTAALDIGARAVRAVPNQPGGLVHDYVLFYFAPRSPMLYAINGRRVAGGPWRQGGIVHFETTVDRPTGLGVRLGRSGVGRGTTAYRVDLRGFA